jgi:hypothetical protein
VDSLRTPVRVEAFVRVSDEWQARRVLVLASLCGLSPVRSTGVVLVNLVNGEILRIDVRLQLGLKRRTDATKRMPVDATEEGMLLDFAGATKAAQAIVGIAYQAREGLLATSQGQTAHWKTHRLTKSSASAPSCWSGGKCRLRGQSTILR